MIWPFSTIERLRTANHALTAHHIAAKTALAAADAARRLADRLRTSQEPRHAD